MKSKSETIKILREFNGEFCSIKLRSDGIMQINTMLDVEYDLKEVSIVVENVLSLAENKEYYLLIVTSEDANVTLESMKLLSDPIAMSYAKAKAYVINAPAQKIMANFYLKVIKPNKPVRFFKNQNDAEMWLKSLAQSEE